MKIKSGLIIATVAGSLAGVANAEDLQRTALEVDGYTTPHGYVYINQGTGERIVSFQNSQSYTALRGAAWAWDNSVIDLADITAFLVGFEAQEHYSDFSPPFGVWDLSDLTGFIAAFLTGCP